MINNACFGLNIVTKQIHIQLVYRDIQMLIMFQYQPHFQQEN